jgi:predicted nucleic acid-binding protein
MAAVAIRAVETLLSKGEAVYYCPQNIAEFWHVATRPAAANGFGFSQQEVIAEIGSIERVLTLLPEIPQIYTAWREVVSVHRVQGIKVFDARLAATAIVYGVDRILTFNGADFKRFGKAVVDPTMVAT